MRFDDDNDDEYGYFGDMEGMEEGLNMSDKQYNNLVGHLTELQTAEIDLAFLKVKRLLLRDALAIVIRSPAWRKMTAAQKMKQLRRVYRSIEKMLFDGEK